MKTIKHRKTVVKSEEPPKKVEEVIISDRSMDEGQDIITIDTIDILPTELPEEITNGT